jgi:hypothetical protein
MLQASGRSSTSWSLNPVCKLDEAWRLIRGLCGRIDYWLQLPGEDVGREDRRDSA